MTEYALFHVFFKCNGFCSDTKVRAESKEAAARFVLENYSYAREVTSVMKG